MDKYCEQYLFAERDHQKNYLPHHQGVMLGEIGKYLDGFLFFLAYSFNTLH